MRRRKKKTDKKGHAGTGNCALQYYFSLLINQYNDIYLTKPIINRHILMKTRFQKQGFKRLFNFYFTQLMVNFTLLCIIDGNKLLKLEKKNILFY